MTTKKTTRKKATAADLLKTAQGWDDQAVPWALSVAAVDLHLAGAKSFGFPELAAKTTLGAETVQRAVRGATPELMSFLCSMGMDRKRAH